MTSCAGALRITTGWNICCSSIYIPIKFSFWSAPVICERSDDFKVKEEEEYEDQKATGLKKGMCKWCVSILI